LCYWHAHQNGVDQTIRQMDKETQESEIIGINMVDSFLFFNLVQTHATLKQVCISLSFGRKIFPQIQ
jgi:hypothetical protein